MEQFLARAARLGRSDLILPVYYISVPALENPTRRVNDPLAQTPAAHQRMDWRELRFERFDSPRVRRMLAQMSEQIATALEQMPALDAPPDAAPPPPPPEPPAGSVPVNEASPPPATSAPAKTHFNRGQEYAEKGEYDQAIAEFTAAIELKPDYAEAYTGRGRAYYRKKNYALTQIIPKHAVV
ncbi:MAG: tetratricopeptide repeat protein [Chloroflexaceae bacterium]